MEDLNDPFPLFHLSDLNFDVTLESIASLPSSHLALAMFSSDWDESLLLISKKVTKTWRQRRERVRKEIGTTQIGRFASEQERNTAQWARFELIDLSWHLDVKILDDLTSAQLAVVQFHPDTNKELIAAAEDLFYKRRERDFAAGLNLPDFVPILNTVATSVAPQVLIAPEAPVAVPAPATMVRSLTTTSTSSTLVPPAAWLNQDDDDPMLATELNGNKPHHLSIKNTASRENFTSSGTTMSAKPDSISRLPPSSSSSSSSNYTHSRLPSNSIVSSRTLDSSKAGLAVAKEAARQRERGSRNGFSNNTNREEINGRNEMTQHPSRAGSSAPERERDRERGSSIDRNGESSRRESNSSAPLVLSPHPILHKETNVILPRSASPILSTPSIDSLKGTVPLNILLTMPQLFVSNIPSNITLDEMRKFFGHFEGIQGMTLGRINTTHDNCSGWILFDNQPNLLKAVAELAGVRIGNFPKALYILQAERSKYNTSFPWADMTRTCRENYLKSSGNSKKTLALSRAVPPSTRMSYPISVTNSNNTILPSTITANFNPNQNGPFIPGAPTGPRNTGVPTGPRNPGVNYKGSNSSNSNNNNNYINNNNNNNNNNTIGQSTLEIESRSLFPQTIFVLLHRMLWIF